MSDLDHLQGHFSRTLDLDEILKSIYYFTQYHKLQACNYPADTCVRFPSLRACNRVFKRFIGKGFKTPYSHLYTGVEF